MKVAYYLRQPDNEDHKRVAHSVMRGVTVTGDKPLLFTKGANVAAIAHEHDVLVFWGIGGDAKQVQDTFKRYGKRTVILDKPYTRNPPGCEDKPRYWMSRVSVDTLHPTSYFQRKPRNPDRWANLRIPVKPYLLKHMSNRGFILFDGASNKYCLWQDLPPWPEWGQQIVDKIGEHTKRIIVYRPRPSHNLAPIVHRASLSTRPIEEDFAYAGIVVSHGGNIGYDSVIRGIPHFAIGDSAARPLSQTDWSKLDQPYMPTEEQRDQWLWDLAYCQWSIDEFAEGTAWRYVRETLDQVELVNHLTTKYPEKISVAS